MERHDCKGFVMKKIDKFERLNKTKYRKKIEKKSKQRKKKVINEDDT